VCVTLPPSRDATATATLLLLALFLTCNPDARSKNAVCTSSDVWIMKRNRASDVCMQTARRYLWKKSHTIKNRVRNVVLNTFNAMNEMQYVAWKQWSLWSRAIFVMPLHGLLPAHSEQRFEILVKVWKLSVQFII
jgi:hypothetical protein